MEMKPATKEFRLTANRQKILGLLREAGVPLSPADVQNLDKGLDRVTIYRTLASLHEHHLAHRVQGVDGIWRYCAHLPSPEGKCGGNHPHFLCLSCGAMMCLEAYALPFIELPPDLEVQGKQMVIYGRCAQCRNKRS